MEITQTALRERQTALIQHYLERLNDMQQMFSQGETRALTALRNFDQEWQQLQAQQQRAAYLAQQNSGLAELVALFPDTAGILLMQVDTGAALRWVDDALQWSNIEDLRLRSRLLKMSFKMRMERRDVERAWEHLEDMEGLADRLDDDRLRMTVLHLKVDYFRDVGEHATLFEWAERALAMAQQLNDPEEIAAAYHKLGFACIRLGQSERADTCLHTALEIYQELGMRQEEGHVYNAIASNCFYWDRYQDAVPYGELALAIMREFGLRERERTILANLALYAMGAGDLQKSLHYGQQALIAATESGSRRAEHTALQSLLITATYLGLVEEERVYVERARSHLREMPSDRMEAGVDWSQWLIAHEQGDMTTACYYAEQMALASRRNNYPAGEQMAATSLGFSLCEMGDFDGAASGFLRGIAFTEEETNPQMWAGLAGLSYVEAQRGNFEAARERFDQFCKLLEANALVRLDPSFMVAWSAYRAAMALEDSRVSLILAAFEDLLATILGNLHDERLRNAFLNQYSLRALLAVRSHP